MILGKETYADIEQVINTMMDQLQIFSSEVSRVAREVGTEGILGGQAQISGVDGTWKELTDNGRLADKQCIHSGSNTSQSTSWRKISPIRCEKSPL